MKRIILLAAAVLSVTAISCSKFDENNSGDSKKGKYTVYIGAETTPITTVPITSATLDDPGAGTAKVVWSEGDEIAVVVSGSNTIRKGTLTSGAGTSSAKFAVTGAASPSETYDYAIYPYEYAGTGGSDTPSYSDGTFTVTLPYKQPFATIGDGGESQVFASDVNTMVAKFAGDKFTFNSVCSAVEFKLTSTDDLSSYLYGIYLQSDNSKLSGKATIDMTAATPSLVMANDTDAQHYVYKDNGGSKTLQLSSSAKSVFLVIPAGTYTDLMIQTRVQDSKSGQTYYWSYTKKSSASHTFSVGSIKPISAFRVDNLNTKGTALTSSASNVNNCYRINPNTAKCKICMSVPGGSYNSATSRVVKDPSGTTVFSGNSRVAYVFCVWESEAGLINNLYLQNNWIYFNPKESATGNALLMGVDVNLNPVWSSHIWISDVNDIEVTYDETTVTFMDRNLGATYAPTSIAEAEAMAGDNEKIASTFGCYYQWGSPLPKPGITSVDGHDSFLDNGYVLHKVCNGSKGQSFIRSSDTTFPYANAYKYPNIYNHCGQTGKWTSSTVTITGENRYWSSDKTNLDPCPNGYRVPTKSEFDLLKNAEGSNIHKTASGGSYLENYDGVSNDLFWIPYSGIRACGSNSKTGNIGTMTAHFDGDQYGSATIYPRGYFWYTDLSSNAETAILIGGWNLSGSALSSSDYRDASYYIYICFGGTINAAGSVSGASSNIYHGGASRALMLAMATPIRCVKE